MKETPHQAQGSSYSAVGKGAMRIYNMRFCPYAERSLLVGTAKGLNFEVVNVNLTDKPDWFLGLNPRGQVPTLEFDDGRVLAESLIVSDYFDEIGDKTRALHPDDAFQKAKDKLMVERFNLVISPLYKVLLNLDKCAEDVLTAFESMLSNLELFEKELLSRRQISPGTDFFCGKKPGMLDYMIWPWFERFELFGLFGGEKLKFPKTRFPALVEWTKAMAEDEAVKKWMLPSDVHVKYMKSRFSGAIDYDFLAREQSKI